MSFAGARRRRLAALSLVTVVLGLGSGLVSCTSESAVAPVASTSTIAPLAQLGKEVDVEATIPFPPGFVPIDSRGVDLPHLVYPDLPEAPVPVFGGDAHLSGTVFGPDGPVEGATVRLERFVGAEGGFSDITSGPGGAWDAAGVYGGKFRVRAWQKPNLATTEPQLAFVADQADTNVNLSIGVEKHDAVRLQTALSVGDPKVDQPVTLLVLHDREDVDDNGIVRGKPLPDVDIDLSVGDGIDIDGETRLRTRADGFVRFTIHCTSSGPHDVTLTGDNQSATVTLPDCLAPDASTSSSTTSSTTGGVTGDSTDVAQFPVGQTFTTPYAPAIPPGTYVSDGEANCSTDFEQQLNGDWVRQHITGKVLSLDTPARNLAPSPGAKPCTFRREK